MRAGKPIWTTSSFLIYTGGLTVLGAGIGALGYLSSSNGSGAMAGWSLLVLVVLYALAHDFRRRVRPLAAGIFKSGDPERRAKAIVEATTHFRDPEILARVSAGLGEPMVGISTQSLDPSELLETRGW